MKLANLEEMTKGWFVGNFDPAILKTPDVEVAVKRYNKGDYEAKHYHKVATEITLIVSGLVKMNGQVYGPGAIVLLDPGEETDFEALEDNTVNVVVKHPGASNDKFIL